MLQKISSALAAMRRYMSEAFQEQLDPFLISALYEERLLRQAWSVLFPTEEEETERHKEQGLPSTLEREWAARVIAERSAFAAPVGWSELLKKGQETDGNRRECARHTRSSVIALFCSDLPPACPSKAPNV